jgi:hypothetical protein
MWRHIFVSQMMFATVSIFASRFREFGAQNSVFVRAVAVPTVPPGYSQPICKFTATPSETLSQSFCYSNIPTSYFVE